MKEAKDVLRIVGMILLGLFVFMVVLPLVAKIAGMTFVFLIVVAIKLIKLAVILAIVYLILVGIRALLR
jgi:hypothetical protein